MQVCTGARAGNRLVVLPQASRENEMLWLGSGSIHGNNLSHDTASLLPQPCLKFTKTGVSMCNAELLCGEEQSRKLLHCSLMTWALPPAPAHWTRSARACSALSCSECWSSLTGERHHNHGSRSRVGGVSVNETEHCAV